MTKSDRIALVTSRTPGRAGRIPRLGEDTVDVLDEIAKEIPR